MISHQPPHVAIDCLVPARRSRRDSRGASGYSLIELMVALAVASIVMAGMSQFFVTSSRAFSDTERTSRQIENGRYATALLSEDIGHAGFYGEVGNVVNLPAGAAIAMPASLPDPCATSIASVAAALPLPIQGVDAPTAAPTCLPDYVSGTDVLVIRRSNTTTIAAGSIATGGYYTQASFCATESPVFKIAQSGFTLTGKDCTTVQPVRQYHVYLYYVASCSVGKGTGGACLSTDTQIPTLKRAELATGGSITISPLVEGVENMQIEYGLDTTGDGVADSYTAAPASVTQWAQVVAIRLHLLVRNTQLTPGYTDTKTYQLGVNSDGSANTSAPGGGYRRHAYTELVRVQNVSQRLESTFP